MEISQESIENCTADSKTKLTDDLFRLLQVREKNKDMAKDWLLFINTSRFRRLRPGEIYTAFKMAISRELLDEKGKEINILPELSNNTTGIVLSAYLRWKQENTKYQAAKQELRIERPKTVSDEEKKEIREQFLQMVFGELKKDGFSDSAWILFEDIRPRITTPKEVMIRLFRAQRLRMEKQKKTDRFNISKITGSVENTCRSIVASNYLKDHLTDFETFKKAIQ